MRTLAFDTSTKYMSVACLDDGAIAAEFHEDAGVRHSEILVPTIKDMLARIDWDIAEIGLFCVGLGPGSFTGLRIAVSTLKGFVLATGGMAAGVASMDAAAVNAPRGKKLAAPLLDAHKGKVYSCIYDISGSRPVRRTEYLLVPVAELLSGLKEEVVFFGDAVSKYRKDLDSCALADYHEGLDWHPRASTIGLLGIEKAKAGGDDPEALEPMYLHVKECEVSAEAMSRIKEKKK
jgi:tRNA threonylcarbamoyladenosine biosynthesis protein TsaB